MNDTVNALTAEIRRLTECLKRANSQAEHFERQWYLAADDAERYRKLVATGKFCAAAFGNGWGLSCGHGRISKAELDAAADAISDAGAV